MKLETDRITKGSHVAVYTHPIILQKFEGNAIVEHVVHKANWNNVYGEPVYLCLVRFDKTPIGKTYERYVSKLVGVPLDLEKP